MQLSNPLQGKAVNYRPFKMLGVIVAIPAALYIMTGYIHKTPQPHGVVGQFHEPKPVVWKEPVQAIKEVIHAQPQTYSTPHAEPTPCEPCRDRIHDYLARIASPFPDQRNTFVVPSYSHPDSLHSGNGFGVDVPNH